MVFLYDIRDIVSFCNYYTGKVFCLSTSIKPKVSGYDLRMMQAVF